MIWHCRVRVVRVHPVYACDHKRLDFFLYLSVASIWFLSVAEMSTLQCLIHLVNEEEIISFPRIKLTCLPLVAERHSSFTWSSNKIQVIPITFCNYGNWDCFEGRKLSDATPATLKHIIIIAFQQFITGSIGLSQLFTWNKWLVGWLVFL